MTRKPELLKQKPSGRAFGPRKKNRPDGWNRGRQKDQGSGLVGGRGGDYLERTTVFGGDHLERTRKKLTRLSPESVVGEVPANVLLGDSSPKGVKQSSWAF